MIKSRFSVERQWQEKLISIQEMAKKLGDLDATHCSDAEATAEFILKHVAGYIYGVNHPHTVDFIATVLQAYAKLLQDAGVKVG